MLVSGILRHECTAMFDNTMKNLESGAANDVGFDLWFSFSVPILGSVTHARDTSTLSGETSTWDY
jgi:hypothetical protein